MLSTEPSKLIFYRGWPAGEERPDLVAITTQREGTDEHISGMKGLGAASEDENNNEDDDFGIDAWNEEDWEEEDEDDEEEGETKMSIGGEHEDEQDEEDEEVEETRFIDDTGGQWFSFSGGESDYTTDTDIDELATVTSYDNEDVPAEQDAKPNSVSKE